MTFLFQKEFEEFFDDMILGPIGRDTNTPNTWFSVRARPWMCVEFVVVGKSKRRKEAWRQVRAARPPRHRRTHWRASCRRSLRGEVALLLFSNGQVIETEPLDPPVSWANGADKIFKVAEG